MLRIFSRIMVAVLILFPDYIQGQARRETGWNAKRSHKFKSEVNVMLRDVGVPGLSVAVIENDMVTHYGTFGVRQKGRSRKVNRRTVFEACSLSKSFFVFVVHSLVDRGVLDLDTPLHEYLPYEALSYDERYKQITARMVLSHSSGLENYIRNHDSLKLEILFNPGSEFAYSGEGYNYLAIVVEKLLGEPYEHYMDRIVFEPLKLRRTFSKYSKEGRRPSNYAVGHRVFGELIGKWKNTEPSAAGGIHTTAYDYARLICAMFNRKTISAGRVHDIVSRSISLGDSPDIFHWGGGFGLLSMEQDTVIFQNGIHDGFRSWVHYSVTNHKGLVFFSNSEAGMAVAKKLSDLTIALELDPLFNGMNYPLYPGDVLTLVKVYREMGSVALFSAIEGYRDGVDINKSCMVMNRLAWIIFPKDGEVARRILVGNVTHDSSNPSTYYNLAKCYMQLNNYESAYENFLKCKELNYQDENIDAIIRECTEKISLK